MPLEGVRPDLRMQSGRSARRALFSVGTREEVGGGRLKASSMAGAPHRRENARVPAAAAVPVVQPGEDAAAAGGIVRVSEGSDTRGGHAEGMQRACRGHAEGMQRAC